MRDRDRSRARRDGRGAAGRDALAHPAAVHPAPARAAARQWTLWFGLFGAPAAWSVQTLVNLPLAAHACFPGLVPLAAPTVPGLRGIVFAVSLAAITVCVGAAAVAGRTWRNTRAEHHAGSGRGREHAPATALLETGEGRTRFMALAGVLASMTFLIASVVHAVAVFLVRPCGA